MQAMCQLSPSKSADPNSSSTCSASDVVTQFPGSGSVVPLEPKGAHSDFAEAELVAGVVHLLAVIADGSDQHLLEHILYSVERERVAEVVVRWDRLA